MTDFRVDELDQAYAALEKHNYEFARGVFDRAVKSGVHEAALTLGWLSEQGFGGPKDLDRARSLYETGLAHDRRLGAYYLGSLLRRTGQKEEARQLLEESAALGHPSAAYWAYAMNSDAGNEQAARQLLVRAAQLGHAFAQRDLARLEMREAHSASKWLAAMRRYWVAKWSGMSFLVRDVNDPRAR